MDNIPDKIKEESINSFQSTIKKLEKAEEKMTKESKNITLVMKRLNALRIGLAVLEKIWYQNPLNYTKEELVFAKEIIIKMLPDIERIYLKSKEGSPQKTLLKRRLKALELANLGINKELEV